MGSPFGRRDLLRATAGVFATAAAASTSVDAEPVSVTAGAKDNIGTGHKWRLIDDQPWRRAYVVLKPGAKDSFVAKKSDG